MQLLLVAVDIHSFHRLHTTCFHPVLNDQFEAGVSLLVWFWQLNSQAFAALLSSSDNNERPKALVDAEHVRVWKCIQIIEECGTQRLAQGPRPFFAESWLKYFSCLTKAVRWRQSALLFQTQITRPIRQVGIVRLEKRLVHMAIALEKIELEKRPRQKIRMIPPSGPPSELSARP